MSERYDDLALGIGVTEEIEAGDCVWQFDEKEYRDLYKRYRESCDEKSEVVLPPYELARLLMMMELLNEGGELKDSEKIVLARLYKEVTASTAELDNPDLPMAYGNQDSYEGYLARYVASMIRSTNVPPLLPGEKASLMTRIGDRRKNSKVGSTEMMAYSSLIRDVELSEKKALDILQEKYREFRLLVPDLVSNIDSGFHGLSSMRTEEELWDKMTEISNMIYNLVIDIRSIHDFLLNLGISDVDLPKDVAEIVVILQKYVNGEVDKSSFDDSFNVIMDYFTKIMSPVGGGSIWLYLDKVGKILKKKTGEKVKIDKKGELFAVKDLAKSVKKLLGFRINLGTTRKIIQLIVALTLAGGMVAGDRYLDRTYPAERKLFIGCVKEAARDRIGEVMSLIGVESDE